MSRTLHHTNPPMKGKDVVDAQNKLKEHKYYNGAIDGIFGHDTGQACKEAKYSLGYATKDIKATYGNPLQGMLSGTIKIPAAYKIRQKLRRRKSNRAKHREAVKRAGIVANWKWMLDESNKPNEHYAQVRPIPYEHLPRPKGRTMRFDCSGGVTLGYAWTPGVSDPNNEGYNGEGYTGTLMTSPQLREIHANEVKPGDIGVYGNYPGHHAVGALTHGPDPTVFSMGHEGDPGQYKASALASIGPLRWYTKRKW